MRKQRAYEAINRRGGEIADRLIDAVCPIYRSDDRGKPVLEASSVLMRIGDRPLLLTAAHALDHLPAEPMVVGGTQLVEITGPFYRTRDAAEVPDRHDLAIFPLTDPQAGDLGEVLFLDLSELDPNERTDYRPGVGSYYMPIGYPVSKQQGLKGNQLVADPLRPILKAAALAKYEQLKLPPNTHLMLDFPRRRMLRPDGEYTAPHPRGMSGGGVWVLPAFAMLGPVSPKLVAIITEYHERHHQVLTATRIGLCLDEIARRFPELAGVIPGPAS